MTTKTEKIYHLLNSIEHLQNAGAENLANGATKELKKLVKGINSHEDLVKEVGEPCKQEDENGKMLLTE